jgi:L,D-transpeptidase ErfK/SrfK
MHYRFFPLIGCALLTSFVIGQRASLASEKLAIAPLPELPGPNTFLPSAEKPQVLKLNLTKRQVTIFEAGKAVKSYPVAVGKAGWGTPVGTHEVKNMYRNPPWKNPFKGGVIPGGDPANPLGRRWIGFWTNGKNWIGFHGTPNRGSVGRAASHGCVRMYNEDVEEMFEIVKVGTPVIVHR